LVMQNRDAAALKMQRLNRARATRNAVQAQDPNFFAAVSTVMFERDPMGISIAGNSDEYEAEAGTVIPRLANCRSAEDVARVLHEEFRAWFGAETASEISIYHSLAADVWLLKERSKA
jgi:hypothetical protein